jgi:hypothetical protein
MVLEALMALGAVGVAMLAPGAAQGTTEVDLSRAAGTLSLVNSRAGAAIFQAANMRPGQQASGSVRVTNAGTLGATLTVAPSGAPAAADAPSRLLAARLQLAVLDVTDSVRPVTVYSGALAALGTVRLGALAAGAARDFLFVASLPGGTPASDNLVQGASVTAGFAWTATASTPPAPTPTPTPPAPTVTPTPTPTPTPITGTCPPRRVKIRIRAGGRRILRVSVKVGHRHARHVKPRARIKLKVKGARAVKVKVTATLAGGTRLVVKKRVKGC